MRNMAKEAAEVVATLAARGIGIEILEAYESEAYGETWAFRLQGGGVLDLPACKLRARGTSDGLWLLHAFNDGGKTSPAMFLAQRPRTNPVLQMFGGDWLRFIAWVRGAAVSVAPPREPSPYEGDGRRDGDDQMYVDAVGRMAGAMLAKLRRHADKGGWSGMTELQLAGRLNDEVGELLRAIAEGDSPGHVMDEAADVANFAMMLADNYGKGRK